MGRIFAALLWLVALGTLVAGWLVVSQLTGSTRGSASPGSGAASPSAAIPTSRPLAPQGTWKVVNHLSAEHVAVIHVETDRLREALPIAVTLVEPMKKDYTEMLVYFHRPGRRHLLPARRVQWSPPGGYVEIVYEVPVSRPLGLAASAAARAESSDTPRQHD